MVLHKTWYTIAVSLLAALFIMSSVAVFVSPETMIPSLVAGFSLDPMPLEAFELAFLGTNIRNIVTGGFLIFFAFRHTKFLFVVLVLRFFIELLDLIGGFIYNPVIVDLLPVFAFTMGIEIALIYAGYRFITQAEQQKINTNGTT